MDKYNGNSNVSKKSEERESLDPVTKDVKNKTNSLASKFFAQDLKSTTNGVVNDVLLPGIKNLAANFFKKFVDYLFLGGSSSNNRDTGYTNYSNFGIARNVTYSNNGYNYGQPQSQRQNNNASRSSLYSLNDFIFKDRGEAEEVLSQMNSYISRYGSVSVLEFYDLIDQRSNPQDNKFGWRDLSNASVQRSSDGYWIDFPKIIVLED